MQMEKISQIPDIYWAGVVAALTFLVYLTQRWEKQAKKARKALEDKPFDVIIIGAGISGMASAHYLNLKNIKYVIFEKDKEIGGTWLKQRFHGVRFDSFHVQTLFSFAPVVCQPMMNGKAVLSYLLTVARDFGIYQNIKFNEAVKSIDFNSKTKKWTVTTEKGVYQANFVMNANGYYDDSNPNIPKQFQNTPFKGRMLHSMKCDQDRDKFNGEDVVIVGSGATAATMIPELVKQAKSVTLIQRSPSYCTKGDWGQFPLYPTVVKFYGRGVHWMWYIYRNVMNVIIDRVIMTMVHYTPKPVVSFFLNSLLWFYSGLDLKTIRENFTPNYNFGEQRPLVSMGLMECLRHVKIITAPTTGCTEDGVVLGNGTVVKCDSVVLATGFNLEYFKFTISMDGKEVNLYDQVLRKDIWFEGIPNYVNMVLFARLDSKNYSCFTPIVEATAELLAEIMDKMRAENLGQVEIKKTDAQVKRYFPMSSGYFTRNENKCFKGDANELATLGGVKHIVFGYRFNESEYVFS